MGTELDALRKQVKVLEHENSNLEARERRHGNATWGKREREPSLPYIFASCNGDGGTETRERTALLHEVQERD